MPGSVPTKVGTHRYFGSSGSSRACASTSEPTMRWPSARSSSSGCTRSGTWITVMPAASAARVPAGELGEVTVDIRGRQVPVRVVKFPFVREGQAQPGVLADA